MRTDFATQAREDLRHAFGQIGDIQREMPTVHITVPPRQPPPEDNYEDDWRADVEKIFNRIDYMLSMQDAGLHKYFILVKKDIADHLDVSYSLVIYIVKTVCLNRPIVRERFDYRSLRKYAGI